MSKCQKCGKKDVLRNGQCWFCAISAIDPRDFVSRLEALHRNPAAVVGISEFDAINATDERRVQ